MGVGSSLPGWSPGQLKSPRPCWLLMGAAVLLLAACTSTPAARSGQPPAAAVTTSPTTRAAAPPGSLANPRRLDCRNRNVWVPGEDKAAVPAGRGRLHRRAAADPRSAELGARAARQPRA